MGISTKQGSSKHPESASVDSWNDKLKLVGQENPLSRNSIFLELVADTVIASLRSTAQARLVETTHAVEVGAKGQLGSSEALSIVDRSTPSEAITDHGTPNAAGQHRESAQEAELKLKQKRDRAIFLLTLSAEHEKPGRTTGCTFDHQLEAAAALPPETRKPNPHLPTLRKIVRGYLLDFQRQTEAGFEACNVVSLRFDCSRQQAYWEKQPREAFWSVAASGAFHSAVSHNALCRIPTARPSVAWSVLGTVVGTSAAIFKEMYAEAFPGVEPRASVFNDHRKLLEYAASLKLPKKLKLPIAS